MVSIALGLFVIFIVYVMIWSIKNDDARSIGDQTGLIRMREPSNKRPGRLGHRRQAAASSPVERDQRH